MEWISVQERLPEGPTAALVTDGNSVVPADWLEDEQYFYVGRDDAGFPRDRISHWMPFPEPPSPNTPKEMVTSPNGNS